MKIVCVLMLSAMTLLVCNCTQSFKVSEKIVVKTASDSVDFNYQKLCTAVKGLNKAKMHEDICAKYRDVDRRDIERIEVASIKRTASRSKEIGNVKISSELSEIGVEISMVYDQEMEGKLLQLFKIISHLWLNNL